MFENGNPVKGTEGSKWTFPNKEIPPGSTFSIDGGAPYTIKDPSMRNEYNPEGGGDPTRVAPETKGGGGGYGGGSGVPAGFQPGNIGYGSFPALQNFPGVTLANYTPIKAAPYNFTDPFSFAEKYGNFSRGELNKNFNQSQDMALTSLNTELKGLSSFAPAAAALKRGETSLDNQFNQQQRMQQLQSTMPGALGDLAAQADRARSYAAGNLPDAQQNKALELGIRSGAADMASSGGFGASSSAARKVSDLMSADQRFKIAQYGEGLTTSNINEKAQLLLAPTEYSNAGGQINVNPSESTSQLTNSYFGQANQYGAVPATTALSSQTQQNQFTTGLEQNTRQFNASNQLGLSEFNAGATNNFALQQFGYNTAYAGAVAGAAQTNTNTQVALQQQAQYQQLVQSFMQQQQQTQQTNALVSGVMSLLGQGGGVGNSGNVLNQLVSGISSLFGGGGIDGGQFQGPLVNPNTGAFSGGNSGAFASLASGSPDSIIAQQTTATIQNVLTQFANHDWKGLGLDVLFGGNGVASSIGSGISHIFHSIF